MNSAAGTGVVGHRCPCTIVRHSLDCIATVGDLMVKVVDGRALAGATAVVKVVRVSPWVESGDK